MKKSEQGTDYQKETCVSKTKSNGRRCQTMAMAGSEFCFFHNPAATEARKAAQQRGGQANGPTVLPADATDVPLHTGQDVSAFLAQTINR